MDYHPGQLAAFPGFCEVSAAEGKQRLIALLCEPDAIAAEHNARIEAARADGLECVNKGMYRLVYEHKDRPGVVYKIPHAPYREAHHGIYSNLCEYDSFLSSEISDMVSGPVAECKIIWHESGLPVIVMEKVITDQYVKGHKVAPWDDFPDWASRVDNSQVGWSTIDNAWVIYDAGYPESPDDAWDRADLLPPRWLSEGVKAQSRQAA